MDLYGHVLCPTCRTEYRIRRRLDRRARYRFQCKRCGCESSFELTSVRWACERERRERRPAQDLSDPMARTVERGLETDRHDTVYDPRPPVHIAPLLRRGVSLARESSRVSWLRELITARRAQHLAVAASF
jgi:hypothetical protein